MDIDAATLSPNRIYKLLVNTVIPRPIALVSTLSAAGLPNAAPFSFFNAFSNAPPLLVIGIEGNHRDGARLKDTARNIHDRAEFVVNLVSRAIAEKMVICSIDFDEDVNEFAEAGFSRRESRQIGTPGILESPVSFECRASNIQYLPHNRCIVTGEIVHLHFADGVIDDQLHLDVDAMDLVARLHGGGWYSTTRDRFEIDRMSLADWKSSGGR